MTNAYILRVFIDSNGKFGDKASVIIDQDKHISDAERQALTAKLNTVETVFVNDLASASISIMHTQGEIDFAGVLALGAAALLAKLADKPLHAMKGRAGDIAVSQNGEMTWVRASLAAMPPWNFKKLDNVVAVERIVLKETETWSIPWFGRGLMRRKGRFVRVHLRPTGAFPKRRVMGRARCY